MQFGINAIGKVSLGFLSSHHWGAKMVTAEEVSVANFLDRYGWVEPSYSGMEVTATDQGLRRMYILTAVEKLGTAPVDNIVTSMDVAVPRTEYNRLSLGDDGMVKGILEDLVHKGFCYQIPGG